MKKYQINTEENRQFLSEDRETLFSFGHAFPSSSGSSYWLGDDGTPWKDRNRETWITSRMAHVYCLGTMLHHPGSKELATDAIHGLHTELHDDTNGGWYPGVTAQGEPLPEKQCYAHVFVILAATSGILAGIPGSEELLKDAEAVYKKYFWDEKNGLAVDTWNTEFTKLDPYRGINANMHSVEAFLADADATGKEEYRKQAGRIIDHVIAWSKNNDWRIPEHYKEDWTPDLYCNKDKPDDQFKPYGATPGHDIEWARLILQYALSTYGKDSPEFASYLDAAEHQFHRAITDGWNADGAPGIVYTTDWDGKPIVHDRMHWTLAEAINTSSVLYRLTSKPEYADLYAQFMQYLDEYVLDHEHGSWYHQLDRNNHVLGTVWPGKSDLYHALQSTLIPLYDPSLSIATAVAKNKH